VTDSVGNIGAGSDGQIEKGTNKGTIWGAVGTVRDFRWHRDRFVGALELQASNHGGVDWVSILLVELVNECINFGSLREGDHAPRMITCDSNAKGKLDRAEG